MSTSTPSPIPLPPESTLPLLTPQERKLVLADWNDTAVEYPNRSLGLHELIEEQAKKTPDRIALVFEGERLTYAELDRRANQIAAQLRELGAKPDAVVGVFVERSVEMIVGLFGVLKSGAAYLPIDTAFPPDRIAFMLSDAKAMALLTQSRLLSRLPTGAAPVICLDAFDWRGALAEGFSSVRARPDQLAYVIYTSGSTGQPKGVGIEHRNIVNYVLGVSDRLQFTPGMNHASVSTIAADLGNTVIFPSLATGGCLHIISKERSENQALLADYFQREQIDVLKIVPSHMAALLTGETAERVIPKKRLILGGEASRSDLVDKVRELSPETRIFNHYGPTETTVGVLTYDVQACANNTQSRTVPIGKPLPNSRVYILDALGEPVPVGVAGELCIGGAGVGRGYLNRPELTAEKFVADPFQADTGGRLYRTGDRARYLPEGNIEFCGRIDWQVKVHGYRIELGEIEAALRSHEGVRDAVVVHQEDPAGNGELTAYVVPARAKQPLWGLRNVFTLPDGSTVAHLNKNETTYIYNEIFVLQAYLRHGVTIHDGDCVIDAGSNIGLFTVFASRLAKNLRIICFEPNPAAFACLKANTEAWGDGVKCMPFGLSSENKLAELTAFNEFSLLSGFHVDAAKEREVVETYALNQGSKMALGEEWNAGLSELLEHRFETKTQIAELKTLSSIIAHEGLDRIDLLKINVEKSELEVLRGIDDADWPKIRQLVIEVDVRSSLKPITNLLEKNGFDVLVEQDPLLRNTELCYVYAVRPARSGGGLLREQAAEAHVQVLALPSETILTPERLRKHLKERLPSYMVPAGFVLLEKFPLTANGKIDREALPTLMRETPSAVREFARPRSETEQALAAIWAEVMRVEDPGVNDDFFDLGGHSLLAIKIVSRIRDVFDVNLSTQALFEHPTIADLAGIVTQWKGAKSAPQRIERRNLEGASPLSDSQQQLWFLDQLAPGSPVYNIVNFIRFDGRYDGNAVRKTLEEIVRRHESLRTKFFYTDNGPMQTVVPQIDVPLREVDLTALPAAERESEWKRLVAENGRKPFDLTQAPVFRVVMVHMSSLEHRLLLVVHHIIADEWSIEIFHHEVRELYKAFSHGRPSPLPELPIQYADFAAWHRDWIRGEVLEGEIAYWKRELTGAPLVLEIPADKARPAVQSFRGETEIFDLPVSLSEQLKAIGHEEQATLFMVLAASFMTLLHRYTGQDDMLVGTPISGRTRSETENLIGFFLNPVVLRARFNERTTFRSLLRQVRERALRAYAHPDMPFDRLVAELAPERDASQSPLFQVMFVLHSPEGGPEISKSFVSQELQTGTSKFDLTLVFSEIPSGLRAMFEYSTDLFEPATIRRMCGHFRTLVESIARNPDLSISKMPMLTEGECRELLVDWNDTAVARQNKNTCLHQLFEAQAARTPERTALVFNEEEMTYGELNDRANRLAAHLRTLGVRPDELIGLLVDRSPDMVVGLLGILKSGGAYVPLDPSFPENRLSYMIENSRMRILVTHHGLEEKLTHLPSTIVRLDSGWPPVANGSAGATDSATFIPEDKNLAYVLYTSGSTGKPKGVTIPHASIVNFVLSMWKRPGFSRDDTLLAVTTLSFDIAGLEIYVPLTTGGKVVVASHEDTHDPVRLQERIQESRCTVMQATPATWRALVHSGWKGSPKLKILCGGEALPRDLADELLVRCGELWNMYGPTETTVWSAIQRVQPGSHTISVGRPIENTQIYVLDKNRNLVPRGTIGELYIGGDGLARGYLQRDDLTRERFVPNPFIRGALMYRTGDLARWLPDGTIECLGRGDNQVKLRGFRIELGEIEAVLNAHEGIKHCAVIVREDVPGDKKLVAYFESKGAPAPSAGDLRARLEKDLPAYMVPSLFVPLPKLPLTPNGKIDRNAMPEPSLVLVTADANDADAPRDPLEKMLAHIWSKVLAVGRVGLHDNFFDLGGHSLLAVRIVVEVEKFTGTRLPLATLLQAPTVGGLAEILRRKNWTPTWSSLVPVRPGGSRPPLFLIHSHGGNVMEYYPLANELDPDQPVYALQARGLDGKIPKDISLEEMAATYLKEIRSFQPEGPYYLGGFCFGGVVALEAAHQLNAVGDEVGALLLIQSMHPEAAQFKPELTFIQIGWHLARRRINLEAENISQRGWNYFVDQCHHVSERARARIEMLRDRMADRAKDDLTGMPMYYILEALGIAHLAAYRKYEPRPYAGEVILFRARKQLKGQNSDEVLGWKEIFAGRHEIIEVPGHQQNLLAVPNVNVLAKELGGRLAAAQSRYRSVSVKAVDGHSRPRAKQRSWIGPNQSG